LSSLALALEPADNQRLANVCGPFDKHLRQVETRLGVEISNRGNRFQIVGSDRSVRAAGEVVKNLFKVASEEMITPERVHLLMQDSNIEAMLAQQDAPDKPAGIQCKRGIIKGRGANQQRYLRNILSNDINFGVGPAGTGKTYLAVACAVAALET